MVALKKNQYMEIGRTEMSETKQTGALLTRKRQKKKNVLKTSPTKTMACSAMKNMKVCV